MSDDGYKTMGSLHQKLGDIVGKNRENIEKNKARTEEVFELLKRMIEDTNIKVETNMKSCQDKFEAISQQVEKNKEE